jgi:transposase InsO family protein
MDANAKLEAAFLKMLARGIDGEEEKAIKIPTFSDGTDWEAVVFELEINLEKFWKHKSELDIIEYLNGSTQICDIQYIKKADKMIYHALTTASKRESFARKAIMAARHEDAVPKVLRNEGLKLFNMFNAIFLNKGKDQANLPNAQASFFQIKMNKEETAKDYISRVDKAVSDLAILNEKISTNSWRFIMANGLRPEYEKCRSGVSFSEPGYDTVQELKAKILKEENVLNLSSNSKAKTKTEMASVTTDNCAHCNKKGHIKADCFALKKLQKEQKAEKSSHWCDYCNVKGHTTDWCFWNPANAQSSSTTPNGKGKGKPKGKGKGKVSAKGKGKNSKGKGRGSGNFPASYTTDNAHYAQEPWQNWESSVEFEGENSAPDWHEYNFSIFENIKEEKNDNIKKDDDLLKKTQTSNWLKPDFSKKNEYDTLFVIFEKKGEELTAWTQNNLWTQLDFNRCTWDDQLTLATDTRGRPECDYLFTVPELEFKNDSLQRQREERITEIKSKEEKGDKGLWMYLDSGASRSVIREDSPLTQYLYNLSETNGSCNVGNGATLEYLQKGMLTNENEVTVVRDLQYDLYSAVAAAKRGVSCVIDFNSKGENQSFLLCKKSNQLTPLIERKQGILEIPVHLYIDHQNDKGLMATEIKLPMSTVSKFWHGMDRCEFDPEIRSNNTDDLSLFMFDIIKSLSEKQRDYLIHARLAHLPRKAILQLIKDGATGLPYTGKFKELCRPCLEAKQRAENHGKSTIRHPEGKPGEHLHSDLAVLNTPDFGGFKYVLTVVDEITDEVITTLLKTKDAQTTLHACQTIHKLISARNNNVKLKSWQFDRGTEFLNDLFDNWIVKTLGAQQLFSNVEHPWENGRAERSFQSIFNKARAMLNYADLPMGLWGKAVIHAVYLKNRCPSSRLNNLAPLQFRTGEKIDFKRLRVFGCPAQIFVRSKDRDINKLSPRSETGIFLGMSKLGNGYVFRIQRNKKIVEVDSADVKFNETFSDCRDRKGRIIEGGRVLDPELFNIPEPETETVKPAEQNHDEISRFTQKNYYKVIESDDELEIESNPDNSENNEIEININDSEEEFEIEKKNRTKRKTNGKKTKSNEKIKITSKV